MAYFWRRMTRRCVATLAERRPTKRSLRYFGGPQVTSSAPLQILPVPADCWKSMSLDFVFGLPTDDKGITAYCCLSAV
ncbi:Inositol-3-phosphate synthase [Phytophthora palmivora]|uniref:Inositol-3-phosphate synthase n=1 Tax=Phytophthora palmivora TaxID=4796 RepID=A0A2P4X8A7_9STRA|nr:Inositol-3-phosphate synthase [Phytophthora palmivora]